MRTKAEIVEVLARRRVDVMLRATKWSDVVDVLTNATQGQRQGLVNLIISRADKGAKAGIELQKVMMANAMGRAKAEVEALLVDDSLSLSELDELL